MESPTNFKQRYANHVSLHSTATVTLPTAQWQLLLNEEMITPFQRQAVPLCLEKKKELKIRSNNNKKPRNTGGKDLVGSWMELVGGLTCQARPAHTHTCDSHFAPDCHRHKHTSTALFPFAQANTYREWLSSKGSWGEGKGGAGSIQGKINASKGVGQRPCHFQLLQACPGLLGVGSGSWGVEKDSRRAGRHDCHTLGDSKPVTVAAATMSCAYCADIWQRGLCSTRGTRSLGLAGTRSWRGMPCADVLWELTGRPAGYKAARLCDPQLPIRTAPGIACRRARPGDTPSPLLLPPLLPLTLWRVNVLPGNQSQRSPRCSQKRFSSNIDNRSLWKFTSTVDAVASRRLCFCSCFWANSLCWSSMDWGWQLRAWGRRRRLQQLPVAAAAAATVRQEQQEQLLLLFLAPTCLLVGSSGLLQRILVFLAPHALLRQPLLL